MKNFSLLCASLLTMLPVISMAIPCSCPTYNYNYTGTVKGHAATITKSQAYQATNNTCTINSVITVNAFITKVVNQQEVGICNGSNLTSQTFSTDQDGSMQPVTMNAGAFGPLFFALYLSNAVVANNTVCPSGPVSVLINGDLTPMQCTQMNPVTITTRDNQTIAATNVTYTALDNSTSLSYAFDDKGVMVSATSPTSSAIIS